MSHPRQEHKPSWSELRHGRAALTQIWCTGRPFAPLDLEEATTERRTSFPGGKAFIFGGGGRLGRQADDRVGHITAFALRDGGITFHAR